MKRGTKILGMGSTYCSGVGCSLRAKCARHADDKKKNIKEFGTLSVMHGERCEFFIDTGHKPPMRTFDAEDT